jgi:hypothetical protein
LFLYIIRKKSRRDLMENERRKKLLEKLGYSEDKRNQKWKEFFDCRSIVEEIIKKFPDEQEKLQECLSKMDQFIEDLIDKILRLEEAVADLHETVEEDCPWPNGDGGGCHGPGSPDI